MVLSDQYVYCFVCIMRPYPHLTYLNLEYGGSMIPGNVVIQLEDYMVRMQRTTSPDLIVQIDV